MPLPATLPQKHSMDAPLMLDSLKSSNYKFIHLADLKNVSFKSCLF